MNLKEIQQAWHAIGVADPMFGVLSYPEKLGRHWDPQVFYDTGRSEIEEMLQFLDSIGTVVTFDIALDFGCGLGRLSSALADRFRTVLAVDIAQSMLDQGAYLVRKANIRWLMNARSDLAILDSNEVNFIYCTIVLQHMPLTYSLEYIREFVRVVKPGGVAVFELPDKAPLSLKRKTGRLLQSLVPYMPEGVISAYNRSKYQHADDETIKKVPRGLMYLYGERRSSVEAVIGKAGGTVVAVRETAHAGPAWKSYQYVVTK